MPTNAQQREFDSTQNHAAILNLANKVDSVSDSVKALTDLFSEGKKSHDVDIKQLRDDAKADREAAAKNLSDMADKVFNRLDEKDANLRQKVEQDSREFREGQKAPWRIVLSLLALVFAILSAVYGSLHTQSSRIEADTKLRDNIMQENIKYEREATLDLIDKNHQYMFTLNESLKGYVDKRVDIERTRHEAQQEKLSEICKEIATQKTRVDGIEATRKEHRADLDEEFAEIRSEMKINFDTLHQYVKDVDKYGSRKWIKGAGEE